MATGPEHYAAGELALERARKVMNEAATRRASYNLAPGGIYLSETESRTMVTLATLARAHFAAAQVAATMMVAGKLNEQGAGNWRALLESDQ